MDLGSDGTVEISKEWQEFLSNPENWPEPVNLPDEWRLSYWVTKEVYADSHRLSTELEERGLSDLFNDVLIELGYQVSDDSSGKKKINLTRQEQMHSIRRIARFLLDYENEGKAASKVSSELRELGYHAQ